MGGSCGGNPRPTGTAPNALPNFQGDVRGTLLKIALAAGNSPSQAQFDDAVRCIDSIKGGDSSAALGMVETLRNMPGVPYDNQLLAALDHYYTQRAVHAEFGIPAGPLLIANALLALWKCAGLPFPTDSSKPYSPPSLLQWAAGNWGVADAVEGKR